MHYAVAILSSLDKCHVLLVQLEDSILDISGVDCVQNVKQQNAPAACSLASSRDASSLERYGWPARSVRRRFSVFSTVSLHIGNFLWGDSILSTIPSKLS
jgi:hypothetical protein